MLCSQHARSKWCSCGKKHRKSTWAVRAGVCFYNRESLPGYSAIFRHANDELNYCYYLIPCGKDGMCGDVTVRAHLPGSVLM